MERLTTFFLSIADILSRLTDLLIVKLLVGLVIWIYSPWREAYGILGALVALDFLTGVIAARYRGHHITSAIMATKTGAKLVVYGTALAAINLAERGIGMGALFTGVGLGMLIVTEALSILENLQRIYPDLPILQRLESLLRERAPRSDV